jgi:hypothetical protein
MVITALNQEVRGADAAMPVSGIRGSAKYAGTVGGVSFLGLNTDNRRISQSLWHPLADQPNSTIHDRAGR